MTYDHIFPLDSHFSKDREMMAHLVEMDAVDVVEDEQDGNTEFLYYPKG